MSDYLDPNNEELLKDFFAEAEQQVETLESNILIIENDPGNHEAVDEIFRAAHTLKGGSATVEMTELSTFTHKVEDVLDEIRSDRLSVDEAVVDVLLSSIDVIKAMLEARANGSVYTENIDSLVEKLHKYIPEKGAKKAKAPSAAPKTVPAPAPEPAVPEASSGSSDAPVFEYPELKEDEFNELSEACEGSQKLWRVAVKFDQNNPMNSVGGIQVFAALKALGSVLKTVPDFDALYEDEFHENVFYYLASDSTAEKIEDTAFLGDVTICTDAQLISGPVGASSASSGAVVETAVTAASEKTDDVPEKAPSAAETNADEKAAPSAEQPSSSGSSDKKPELEHKKEGDKPGAQHSVQQNSVLRVDSKRIDYLLNLVSETVIAKASFNQLAATLSNELTHFQSAENIMKTSYRRLMERIPMYLEQIQEGKSIKDVRAEIMKEYDGLGSIFDADDAELKAIATKLRSSTQNLGRITGELQEGVMKIRMVPINQIFSRFPRVVRD